MSHTKYRKDIFFRMLCFQLTSLKDVCVHRSWNYLFNRKNKVDKNNVIINNNYTLWHPDHTGDFSYPEGPDFLSQSSEHVSTIHP